MSVLIYIYNPETEQYISSTGGLVTTPDNNCIWGIGFDLGKENSLFKIQEPNSPNHCFGIDSNNTPDFNYDCSKYSWFWNITSKYLKCNKLYLSINNKNELFFDVTPSTTWELICPGTWQDWKTCTGNNCHCKQIKEYICTPTMHNFDPAKSQYKSDCKGSWSEWGTCKDNKQTRTYIQNPKKCGLGTECDIKNGEVQTNSCDSNQIMYYNNDLTLFFSEKKPSNISGYLTKNIFTPIISKFSGQSQIIQVLQVENQKYQGIIRNNDQILITGKFASENRYCKLYNLQSMILLSWDTDPTKAAKFLIKTINPNIQEIKKGTPFVLIPIIDDTKNNSIQYNNTWNSLTIVKNDYDKDTFLTFYDKDGIPPGPTPPGPTPPGPTPPQPTPPGPTPPGPTPPGPTPSQNHKTIIIVSSSIAAFIILCISLFLVFRKK
jgi:hypothetical protein